MDKALQGHPTQSEALNRSPWEPAGGCKLRRQQKSGPRLGGPLAENCSEKPVSGALRFAATNEPERNQPDTENSHGCGFRHSDEKAANFPAREYRIVDVAVGIAGVQPCNKRCFRTGR